MKKIQVTTKHIDYTSLYCALQNCHFYYKLNEAPLWESFTRVVEYEISPEKCEKCGFFISPINKQIYTKGGAKLNKNCVNCGHISNLI